MTYKITMFQLDLRQIKKALRSRKKVPNWLQRTIPWGRQVRMVRTALGMTQAQLAERMKTNQHTIVRLEKEEVDPQLSTLKRVADGLNCELVIRLVPKIDLEQFLAGRALAKATELIKISAASSNIELQKPSAETMRFEIKRLAEKILTKKRSSIWEE
ncbi:MAG TPA: hypothetical protein DF383_07945 [Deltaproteobacteria bacterium]|nr:hypothetical protein [Deltaproteobacteria bacterium]